jgi:hypothetical protein
LSVNLSKLHGVLKDETRARILNLLGEKGTLSYTELQSSLGIEHTGRLNYHLKVLGDLLSKDEQTGRYALSEKGMAAVQLLGKFQASTAEKPQGLNILGPFLLVSGMWFVFGWTSSIGGSIGACASGQCGPGPIFALILSAAFLTIAFAEVGTGMGLLLGRMWARRAAILVLAVSTVLYVVEVGTVIYVIGTVAVETFGTLFDLGMLLTTVSPQLVIMAVCVFYLTRPNVKRYFDSGLPRTTLSASPRQVVPQTWVVGVVVGLVVGAALAGTVSYYYFVISPAQLNDCGSVPDRFQVDAVPRVNASFGLVQQRLVDTTIQPLQVGGSRTFVLNDSIGEFLAVVANFSSPHGPNSGFVRIDYCLSGMWFQGDEIFNYNSTFIYSVPPSTHLSFTVNELGRPGHQNSTMNFFVGRI